MKKLLALAGAALLLLAIGLPALAADDTLPATGRVLISIEGDVTLPATEHADTVVVIQGNALIAGTARAVVVISGTATLRGATVESVSVVDGRAVLEAGTIVRGDVVQLNSTVEQAEGAVVTGTVRSMAADLAGFALFIGFAMIMFWLGGILLTFIAGLALAAFAGRQVRTAEGIISREPLKAFLVGLGMVFLPPILLVLLAITIIGVPLALSLLFVVWPALVFAGYIVAAIWIGDWMLRAAGRHDQAERPYLASFVGLIVAGLLSFVPLVAGIISIFGLGAITVAGWRTLVGGPRPTPTFQPQAAPLAG